MYLYLQNLLESFCKEIFFLPSGDVEIGKKIACFSWKIHAHKRELTFNLINGNYTLYMYQILNLEHKVKNHKWYTLCMYLILNLEHKVINQPETTCTNMFNSGMPFCFKYQCSANKIDMYRYLYEHLD